jgi:hypothetical protein
LDEEFVGPEHRDQAPDLGDHFGHSFPQQPEEVVDWSKSFERCFIVPFIMPLWDSAAYRALGLYVVIESLIPSHIPKDAACALHNQCDQLTSPTRSRAVATNAPRAIIGCFLSSTNALLIVFVATWSAPESGGNAAGRFSDTTAICAQPAIANAAAMPRRRFRRFDFMVFGMLIGRASGVRVFSGSTQLSVKCCCFSAEIFLAQGS